MICDFCGCETIQVFYTEIYHPARHTMRTIYCCASCQNKLAQALLEQTRMTLLEVDA